MKMLDDEEREILQTPLSSVVSNRFEPTVENLIECQRVVINRTHGLGEHVLMFRNSYWGDKALSVDAIIRGIGL